MIRIVRTRPTYLAVPALLLFFWLALNSVVADSPTMDEQNHITRGLVFLRTGDPRFSLEHPPLINTISALPALTIPNLHLPLDDSSWNQREGWYAFAEKLFWQDDLNVTQVILLARLPVVFMTVALALVGYRFALEIWGRLPAFITFLFLLFDPNIMAHGRYSTTDIGGSLFILLSAYLLWRMWSDSRWNWFKLVLAGLGLGLAFGSKMSNLIFCPILALLAILPLYQNRWSWRFSLRRLTQYAVAILISYFTLWAIFGFEWGNYRFLSSSLSPLNQLKGPTPTFFAGIEQILRVSGGGRPSFLLGEFSTEGWWYYFPAAFILKTPLLVIFMFVSSSIYLVSLREYRARTIFLIIPAVLYFMVSLQSSLNIGYRHLLPILPFLYVMAPGTAQAQSKIRKTKKPLDYLLRFSFLGALVAVIIIDISIHPHYLSYFNVLAGGPDNGYKALVDSNVDWGQDLGRLREWMIDNEVDKINLSYFGSADPAYYGIDYVPLPGLPRHFDLWWDVPFNIEQPEPGIYAISVSNLWELPLEDKAVFKWFREQEPDAKIGYSINIYVVTEN